MDAIKTEITADKTVGKLLQHWRNYRRKSQLTLALDADVSQRHVSFVESGRSTPSREMILNLADALDVPLRERNTLLTAAGYAPVYQESSWNDPEIGSMHRALELILAHQEPFPAVVMDRHWNIIKTNRSAPKFFGLFVDLATSPAAGNVLRMIFHPEGIRPFITNWEKVARGLIQRVSREAVGGFIDQETKSLLNEILSYPEVPRSWQSLDLEMATLPIIPVEFRKDDLAFDFFSTVTTLGTPQDITLQEVRIECFFPADEKTETAARVFLGP
jgi:transcriptional regulator with XRE-family HTH domain